MNLLEKYLKFSRPAFTMAEILLSLTIIGVVAAITLPSLTGNINERTWNTQRKALYSRLSQAVALMPSINGFGTARPGSWDSGYSDAINADAEIFVTNGLSKVLKLNNVCDKEHLQDCGLPDKIIGLNGKVAFSAFPKTLFDLTSAWSHYNEGDTSLVGNIDYDMNAAAFETANGESVAVYYNPLCRSKNDMNAQTYKSIYKFMCANFIYDLNGKKGPNSIGKDMGFMSLLYSFDSVLVAPMPLLDNSTQTYTINDAQRYCRGKEDARLPNMEELSAMFFNKEFLGQFYFDSFWSGTVAPSGGRYVINLCNGVISDDTYGGTRLVRCVKRN